MSTNEQERLTPDDGYAIIAALVDDYHGRGKRVHESLIEKVRRMSQPATPASELAPKEERCVATFDPYVPGSGRGPCNRARDHNRHTPCASCGDAPAHEPRPLCHPFLSPALVADDKPGKRDWFEVWRERGVADWNSLDREAIANYFFDEGTRWSPRNPRNDPSALDLNVERVYGVERIYGPAIMKDGELFALRIPASHYAVAKMMERDGRKEPLKGAQGFYTTRSGFIDRRAARQIADRAGQIVNPISGSDELFSEELWLPRASTLDLNAVAEEMASELMRRGVWTKWFFTYTEMAARSCLVTWLAIDLRRHFEGRSADCTNCATGDERNLATLASLDVDHRSALQNALEVFHRALVEHCTDSLEAEKFAIRAHAEAVKQVKPSIFEGRS